MLLELVTAAAYEPRWQERGAETPRGKGALEPAPVDGRLDDGRHTTLVGSVRGRLTGSRDGTGGAIRVSRTVASSTSIERKT